MYKPTCASPILKEICEKIGRQDLLPQYTQVVRVRQADGQGDILEQNKQGRHRSPVEIDVEYPNIITQTSYRMER